MPRLICVCGCNGSGKSTFARLLAMRENLLSIDPDQLAADGLSSIQAGKTAANMARDFIRQGISFIGESTLSSHFDFRIMEFAKEHGYRLELVYIRLENIQIALQRIQGRVSRCGHDIPRADVVRRFNKSLLNLAAAMKFADATTILDNSARCFRIIPYMMKDS